LLALDACLARCNEIRRLADGIEHRIVIDGGKNAKVMRRVRGQEANGGALLVETGK